MSRLPLRVRLTLLVTILFGLAFTVAATLGLSWIEHSLRSDAQGNAESLLADYVGRLADGSIGPAIPGPEAATQFFYVDAQGYELQPFEYEQVLVSAVGAAAAEGRIDDGSSTVRIESVETVPPVSVFSSEAQSTQGPLVGGGPPVVIDRGDNVIAVGVPVTVGATALTIAVSTPLQPVTDSLETLTRLLFVLVPALTAVIAAATWIIVGRALRPVDAITAQVDRISTKSLHQRVPEPAASDELGHLAATMNRMLARLERARDAQRQFISDASHELRSPISATQATLEVALDQPELTEWPVTARILHDENLRLANLVDDLLLLAQLDEIGSIRRDAVDLDEVCLTEAQRPHPKPVVVHVESPARIAGNEQHLTRAIRNLVENAARHATGRVDLTVSLDREMTAIVDVRDDGPGIPSEYLELIFDRFGRLDASRNRESGGAGLGLAIARQVAEAHGGSLTASNVSSGTGALFTLKIPVGPDATSPPVI